MNIIIARVRQEYHFQFGLKAPARIFNQDIKPV